jgi:hypothetical protein
MSKDIIVLNNNHNKLFSNSLGKGKGNVVILTIWAFERATLKTTKKRPFLHGIHERL